MKMIPLTDFNETFMEEFNRTGEMRHRDAVMTRDSEGYHMRDAQNLFGPYNHSLSLESSPERVEAHWRGFIYNMYGGK